MSTEVTLPRNFMRPCVLLLLRESPAHGYDLVERLRAFGFGGEDPGRLYRTLRTLETEGLVRSAWEASAHGPDRRIYALTGRGMEALHEQVAGLRAGAGCSMPSSAATRSSSPSTTRRPCPLPDSRPAGGASRCAGR